jgi:uncharacterized protein YjdB
MRITTLLNKNLPAAAWGFLAASFFVAGCAGVASSPNPPTPPVTPPAAVSVSVAPTTSTVQSGQTQKFTATVTNDSQNKGVTWALSGTGCSGAACGVLSATSSASGAAITYTAPATAPAPASVTLTATSVADGTKSAAATITVTAAPAAITVSISPQTASVAAGGTQAFTATVTNDAQNKGVTWTLSGAGCSGAACGVLSATSSASGTAITYTAPATAPAPASVMLTATSVADGTKSAAATITVTAAPAAITVSVSPQTASVAVGGTQTFAATVTNDSGNKGVTWTLSGTGCSGAACGSVSPASSASGAAVTYTAAATAPSGEVTLKATSVADATKSAAATITVTSSQLITVAISPTSANVQVSGTQSFTATVTNDSQNKGVNWTLSGAACSEGNCGTIAPTTSASGIAITYTAPPTLPSPATINLTAASAADPAIRATALITVTAPPSPSTPLVLGTPAVEEGYGIPVVATDAAGNIDVAWAGELGPGFVRSTDGGATFSTPVSISSDLSQTTHNKIQMRLDASGNINLLWWLIPSATATVPESFFSRSTDSGHTFSAPVNVAPAGGQLAVQPNGTIVVAWFDPVTNNLLSSHSSDGVNFSTPGLVWTAADTPMDLDVAVGSQGQIDLFWTEMVSTQSCNILFSGSPDAVTFSSASTISGGSGRCNAQPQTVVDSTGNINVAWNADGDALFFSRSIDSGSTFSTPTSVPTGANPVDQQIAVGADGTIYIISGTQPNVSFSRSVDNGATFSPVFVLSLQGGSSAPTLGVDSCNNVSVVGQGPSEKIFFQRSTDGGLSFGQTLTLSNTLFDYDPRLAVDLSGNVNVVYDVDGPSEVEYVRVPTSCTNH